MPDYLTWSPTEPAIPISQKLWINRWLEPRIGEAKGDVGPNTPWQLSASGFVSLEKGQILGAKSTSDVMRNRERPPCCYGQCHPFSSLCCDHLMSAAQCLELLGQRGLCVSVATLCSASICRCVVINIFVSKQKPCSALIHRILNLMLSQRNNLPCGTDLSSCSQSPLSKWKTFLQTSALSGRDFLQA